MATVEGLDIVLGNLKGLPDRYMEAATVAAKEIASYLEQYAIMNHEWVPRTGATDVTTIGTVRVDLLQHLVYVILSAGMSYDVFLELARSGRWSWLKPAVLANREEIMQTLGRYFQEISLR